MSSMPQGAKKYLVAVCLLGLAALIASQLIPFPQGSPSYLELIVFIVLGVVAGGKKVSLNPQRKEEEAGSMSLGFALTFATLLHFGPAAGVLIALAGCVSSCIFPKRQRFHQLSFNLALSCVEALLGGTVFASLNGWGMELQPVASFIAVAGSSLTFFLVNTIGVAIMISFYAQEPVGKLWKENFLWTAPSYFASACVGAIGVLFLGNGSASAVLLFVLPVAYLVYQSYVTYISRATEKQKHIEQLQQKQAELADLYLATIKSMALAIDAKDQYTHQHIVRVQRYAVAIAEEMGLDEYLMEAVRTGALLHDIGKLGVPEYVLLKPGKLSDEEYEKIKMHPAIGAAILEPVEFPWPVIPIVRHHHEKWDGTGYPDGLKGEEIPLTARIMAVADVYDALTSTRSYRQAWTHEKTVSVIKGDAGIHFDPAVVEAFARVIDRVVAEMAEENSGPLARKSCEPGSENISKMAVEHISRTSTELWALYEVAQSLSSSLGVSDTIQLLAKKIESIYPGSSCVFMVWNEQACRLEADSAFGLNAGFFEGAYSIGDSCLSRQVLHSGDSYLGAFQADDLMLNASPELEWDPLNTALIVPVRFEGGAIATINLYHTDSEAFSQYDRQLLELIAERAGHAIQNGLLFDRARGDSLTDPLTGLHNLRFLTDHVETLCRTSKQDERAEHCLLCLDLDSFKPINDNFGHLKGDGVLVEIGKILLEQVGQAGIVARYGGDEFVIVLKDASRDRAEQLKLSIEKAIDGYDPRLKHPKIGKLRLGVSIGLACYPTDARDCAGLISVADQAMYQAKTERRLESLAREDVRKAA